MYIFMPNNNLIGNGLVASALQTIIEKHQEFFFYASGVSDSEEYERREFLREKNLLQKTIKHNQFKRIVYFSTCSVYSNISSSSPYVNHKIEMESIVLNSKGGVVVRVPQLIGKSGNNKNLFRFLYDSIKNNKPINIFVNAERNIIDIDDMIFILSKILNPDLQLKIINIAKPKNDKVCDVVLKIENFLGKPSIINYLPGGDRYYIDISNIDSVIKEVDFNNNYLENILKKYFSVN
jgi:nucleoside-diphosphate-sugar epimerase